MSNDKPHFIEVGDADDIAQPLPIFVTKQRISGERNERSHYRIPQGKHSHPGGHD